jgi:hypothetical protein
MDARRLKAICARNRTAITKLSGQYTELKEIPVTDEIAEEIHRIPDSLA